VTAAYPSSATERTRWILDRRGLRNAVLSDRPYAHLVEQERLGSGAIGDVATIFLSNRECPWKCVMCDLWQNTTITRGTPGEILAQIQFALDQLAPASVLKLYNSGSFFDPGAIPGSDWKAIAALCNRFKHLIVECHPRLIDQRVIEFKEFLSCSLEIAMGLETAHSTVLDALNKRFTLHDFERATAFLKQNNIQVRTFLLVQPPFVPKGEQFDWLTRSIRFAFDSGSDIVSLIPLRAGNGAIEELIRQRMAEEPALRDLEAAQEFGIELGQGRVFADTWNLARFSACEYCLSARRERILRMNLAQEVESPIRCASCGNG
jgi:radical SAM enzyme (TIGR01210 family)